MKVFAIFLCIAISYVFGELERYNFEENLKVNEDIEQVDFPLSLDEAKQTNSSDEILHGKYAESNDLVPVPASAQAADSLEKELSVLATSTVKPSSSKTIKNLKIMYLEKPAQYLKVLQKVAHPDITRTKTIQRTFTDSLKSFLNDKDELSRKQKNLASNTRKSLRRKRMAEVNDPRSPVKSLKVYIKTRGKLPKRLRLKSQKTDKAELKLLEKYAKSKSASSKLIARYNTAKTAERKVLKEEVDAAGSGANELIDNYKALRKGSPWNYIKRRATFKKFFKKPSTALTEYEALKLDELSSIDSFLGKSSEAETAKSTHEKGDNSIQAPQKFESKTSHSGGRDVYLSLSSAFQPDLRVQIMNTDIAEEKVLTSYMESDYVPKNILDRYYEERKKEITMLKEELTEAGSKAPELLTAYKGLRTGVKWHFFMATGYVSDLWFNKPSAGRSEFEALKRKELDIDRYLDGTLELEDKAPEKEEKAKAEEIQRASAREEQKAKEEEDDREKAENALKKGADADSVLSSFAVMKDIRMKLPEGLRGKITITNDAEDRLLDSYASSNSAPPNVIDDYNAAKTNERQVLKEEIQASGNGGADIIANYKTLRKGSAWNFHKLHEKYKAFFDKPSAGLTEYENLKKDELSIDTYLKNPRQSMFVEENKEAKIEEDNRMARAEVAERARAEQEEERAEEMEREMRDRDIETLEAEEAVYRESAEDVVATIDETKGDIEMYGSPDSVTSADVTITKTATNTTEAKNNSNLLRFAIFFALVMQGIIAILILGPQSDKLVAWCRRMKRAEASPAETEALYVVNKPLPLGRPPKSRGLLSTPPS